MMVVTFFINIGLGALLVFQVRADAINAGIQKQGAPWACSDFVTWWKRYLITAQDLLRLGCPCFFLAGKTKTAGGHCQGDLMKCMLYCVRGTGSRGLNCPT